MFPLYATTFPRDGSEFKEALRESLSALLNVPDSLESVTINGDNNWPSVDALKIKLDGASLKHGMKLENPGALTHRERGLAIRQLDISGRNLEFENGRGDFALTATNAAFDFARNSVGTVELVLEAAEKGEVQVHMAQPELDALVLNRAKAAAAAQGVKIETADVKLKSLGRRSIEVEARVMARKVFTAVIRITGRLDITDALIATVSNLKATGEGIVSGVVVGFIQPRLDQVNGASLALTTSILGNLKLTDVALYVENGLRVEATFGQ